MHLVSKAWILYELHTVFTIMQDYVRSVSPHLKGKKRKQSGMSGPVPVYKSQWTVSVFSQVALHFLFKNHLGENCKKNILFGVRNK